MHDRIARMQVLLANFLPARSVQSIVVCLDKQIVGRFCEETGKEHVGLGP